MLPAGGLAGNQVAPTGYSSLPTRKYTLPHHFQTDDEQREQLRRCLNDDTIPLEARIVGALIRLYGMSVVRIVALTHDKFHRDNADAYLTLGQNPVLLPPKLAQLIERQITRPRAYSVIQRSANPANQYLLPGKPPDRPRHPHAVCALLRRHQLPTASARNTALIDAAGELPPIMISDLLASAPRTRSPGPDTPQTTWADYLAAARPH
jgi:hypothetical protein